VVTTEEELKADDVESVSLGSSLISFNVDAPMDTIAVAVVITAAAAAAAAAAAIGASSGNSRVIVMSLNPSYRFMVRVPVGYPMGRMGEGIVVVVTS